MAERIAVGDFVRLSPTVSESMHPRATDADIGSHTTAYVVTAYDKDTKIAKLAKQGQPFGDYPEDALIKVEPPIDNTIPKLPEAPPPDTMTGGQSAMAARGTAPTQPGPRPTAVNPFPPKGR